VKRPVIHFEIGCDDLEKTSTFYKNIFGWEATPNGEHSLGIETGGEGIPGHFAQLAPDEAKRYINIYIETDTLEADLEAITAGGGKVIVPPVKLANGRTFAWFEDVSGNKVGLLSPE